MRCAEQRTAGDIVYVSVACREVFGPSDEQMVEHMCQVTVPNAKEWLFFMNDTRSQGEFTWMIVTLWAIWSSRRKAIHEDIFQSPLTTHGFVLSFMSDIQFLQKHTVSTTIVRVPRAN